MSDVNAKLSEMVTAHPVVLFMKGSRRFPQCGFSQRVVSILDKYLPKYETVNVLSDPSIRDGIKAFSQWPTIPQLYVRGKFVGGCDIVTEMAESGELATLLGDLAQASAAAPAKASAPPTITITEPAARALKEAAESPSDVPRLVIDGQFHYELYFDEKKPGDFVVQTNGVSLLVDAASATRANGMSIDFVGGDGGGFKMENPNEPPRVRPLSVKDLKAMRDRGEKIELFDTRTPREREQAKIEGDRVLDEEGIAYLEKLSRDTPIAFYCHHGGRSRSAAEQFIQLGFSRVYNIDGGIDAWSRVIDPKVPTY